MLRHINSFGRDEKEDAVSECKLSLHGVWCRLIMKLVCTEHGSFFFVRENNSFYWKDSCRE